MAFKNVRRIAAISLMLGALLGVQAHFSRSFSHSVNGPDCVDCNPNICNDVVTIITADHALGRALITAHITQRFVEYREWLLETFFRDNLLHAMMRMTEQLSAVGMHQMLAVGALMDAKIQLETQRDFQHLQWQALKDYHPSEDFCWFGTNARSLSASEHTAIARKLTLNKFSMNRQLASLNSAGADSADSDKMARWQLFVDENCMVYNNNWDPDNPTISGLETICGSSAPSERANKDVHYSRYIDQVRTIDDVDFSGGTASDNEKDIISLARNLYGHDVLKRNIGLLTLDTMQSNYADLRAVAAKRNVAENSFSSIVSMKTPGTAAGAADTKQYMASLIRDLGIDNIADIDDFIGENPSYYAQLEILAKKIYQNQTFYANLYDKPENVARTAVALRAIELMLDRSMYESRLRKEMMISVLLATKLQENYEEVQSNLIAAGVGVD
ncbi:MAG: hypothetical protein ACLFR0_08300 [Alphaproteobacteria bacterium]